MSLSALLVLLVPCKLTFLRYSNQLQRFFQLSQTLYHPYAILYLLTLCIIYEPRCIKTQKRTQDYSHAPITIWLYLLLPSLILLQSPFLHPHHLYPRWLSGNNTMLHYKRQHKVEHPCEKNVNQYWQYHIIVFNLFSISHNNYRIQTKQNWLR